MGEQRNSGTHQLELRIVKLETQLERLEKATDQSLNNVKSTVAAVTAAAALIIELLRAFG